MVLALRARLRTVALLVLASLLPLIAVTAATATPAAAADPVKVLINLDTVFNANSHEYQQAVALGYSVTQVTGAQWRTMTAADFAQYRALIVGDRCSTVAPSVTDTSGTWAPVVMGTAVNDAPGNRIVIGTDPATHSRPKIIKSGIAFAAANAGRTGLYYDMGCYAQQPAIDTLAKISVGSGTWTTGPAPCGGSVAFIANHPSFADLRTSDLAGWGCSVHIAYPTYPDDYSALAIATDTSTKPVCGTNIDTSATSCGQAYVLVAGSGLVVTAPDMSMSPTTATKLTGNAHTVTADLSVGAVPLTAKRVTFTISGQNAGAASTCAPADCTSGSDGKVQFTYTGAEAGDDTITASFTDSSGAKQQATAAVTWQPGNTAPTVTVAGVAGGATYELGDVPVATCTVSDAQDGLFTVPAVVSPVAGDNAAFGIGTQTAVCAYTDLGGLSDSSTVAYSIADTVKPVLTGAPIDGPNGAGWYRGPVAIHWSAADSGTGINPATLPADVAIGGEGSGLIASASVADNAGNVATSFSTAVAIDATAPTTGIDAPVDWRRGDVNVTLAPFDNLSGVASTSYEVDGGAPADGTTFTVSGEGRHTIKYWSVDKAGNAEPVQTVEVSIDLTPPTISHRADPQPNAAGWNRTHVVVTFTCGDGLSGVRSCTAPVGVTANGLSTVLGEAVDNAGNTSTDLAVVAVDTLSPTIGATVPQPNAAGWYNSAIAVDWDCADTGGSGVATCASPVILGDGTGQSAGGTVADLAGNSASALVGGVNVDTVRPTITGAPTTGPNAQGWYPGDVVIHWTCGDNLSGVVACPQDTTISATGANLGASAVIVDLAGNSAIGNVTGINIDRVAPATVASTGTAVFNEAGWSTDVVSVALVAADETSAIATTVVTVDGGAPAPYSAPIVLGDGVHSVRYHSVDLAGNTEAQSVIDVKVDTIAPAITATRTAANDKGWNNGPVVVTFSCADGGSGIVACPAPKTVDVAGAAQAVVGQVADIAGNGSSVAVSDINVDLVKPVSSASTGTATFNAAGWSKAPVSVSLAATDDLAGVATLLYTVDGGPLSVYGAPLALGNGIHTVHHSAVDEAGNVEAQRTLVVKVDTGIPVVTYTGSTSYTVDQVVSITCAATDTLSGVASTTCANVQGPAASFTTGDNTRTATATDVAGNAGSGSVTFKVTATFDSLCGLTKQYLASTIDPGRRGDNLRAGLQTVSLCVKLNAAEAAGARGLTRTKANILDAYEREVRAYSGKWLTVDQANTLIRLSNLL